MFDLISDRNDRIAALPVNERTTDLLTNDSVLADALSLPKHRVRKTTRTMLEQGAIEQVQVRVGAATRARTYRPTKVTKTADVPPAVTAASEMHSAAADWSHSGRSGCVECSTSWPSTEAHCRSCHVQYPTMDAYAAHVPAVDHSGREARVRADRELDRIAKLPVSGPRQSADQQRASVPFGWVNTADPRGSNPWQRD